MRLPILVLSLLLVCSGKTVNAQNADIWIVSVASGGARPLIIHPASDQEPEWSPDGKRILFDSDRAGDADIYVMAPDGSGLQQITSSVAKEDHGAWSPDGHLIAYQYDAGDNTDVWVMRADGTAPRRLTTYPARDGVRRQSNVSYWGLKLRDTFRVSKV